LSVRHTHTLNVLICIDIGEQNELAFPALPTCAVDKSTRTSISTSATRTTARGSTMIANIASMVLFIGLGFVIAIAMLIGVLMLSYKE
jgi:hypothetical protein